MPHFIAGARAKATRDEMHQAMRIVQGSLGRVEVGEECDRDKARDECAACCCSWGATPALLGGDCALGYSMICGESAHDTGFVLPLPHGSSVVGLNWTQICRFCGGVVECLSDSVSLTGQPYTYSSFIWGVKGHLRY